MEAIQNAINDADSGSQRQHQLRSRGERIPVLRHANSGTDNTKITVEAIQNPTFYSLGDVQQYRQ